MRLTPLLNRLHHLDPNKASSAATASPQSV
jgi:hypothetical protein